MNNINDKINRDTYSSMGYLDGILPERIEEAIEMYNLLSYVVKSEAFDELIISMSLEEWWNSFIPENYKEIASLDYDTAVDIVFNVLHKLLVNYDDTFEFITFMFALDTCFLAPFKNKKPLDSESLPSFKKLYDTSSDLITEMCKLHFVLWGKHTLIK